MTATEQETRAEARPDVRERLRTMLERVFDVAEHRHQDRIAAAVARLEASYPNVRLSQANVDALVSGLLDLPADDVEHAVEVARRTADHMPRISELRRFAVEHQLGLPEPGAALELVERWVREGATQRCARCDGTGSDPEATDAAALEEVMPQDQTLRAMLERIREAGLSPSSCAECGGSGKAPSLDRPALPGPVRRALDALGGEYAWRTSENPSVQRGQFNRLYEEFRREAMTGPMSGAKELTP